MNIDRGSVTPDGHLPALDGQQVDLRKRFDSGGDALLLPPDRLCGGPGDPYVARWTFDDPASPWSDGQVQVPAVAHGGVDRVVGQSGCGYAALFTGDANNYIQIQNVPRWASLQQGAIELWARFDGETPGEAGTLFSRDAINQLEGGHLAIAYRAGAVAARLQAKKNGALEEAAYTCAYPDPLVLGDGQWHHVVVSFGGGKDLEIYLDGKQGTFTGDAQSWPCGTKPANLQNQGLGDNQEPMVVGAETAKSTPGGLLDVVGAPFQGAIDELRIHDVRIDY